MAWTTLNFSVGQILTAAQMQNLDDNFEALAAGDSGAPNIVQAALSTTELNYAGSGIYATGVEFTFNAYSFFPNIHAAAPSSGFANVAAHRTDGASADNPRMALIGIGTKTQTGSYDVDARSIDA